MFFKILKKDLKRSKTMNIILFLFIILATVFVASGLNNLVSVVDGMSYFLEEACGEKRDDFLLIEGKFDDDSKKVLDEAKSIKSYDYDTSYYYSDVVKNEAGKNLDWQGIIMIGSPKRNYIKFFDKDNNVIEKVEKGHVYITRKFLNKFLTFFQMKETVEYNYQGREYSAANYTTGMIIVASMTILVMLITMLCILDPIINRSVMEILMVSFALYAFSFMCRSIAINLTKEGKEQRKKLKKVIKFYYNNYKCYSGEKTEAVTPRYNIELSKSEELFLKLNSISYRNDK